MVDMCMYMYENTTKEERGHAFEKEQGGFEGRKGKGEWCNYIMISKNKHFFKKDTIAIIQNLRGRQSKR